MAPGSSYLKNTAPNGSRFRLRLRLRNPGLTIVVYQYFFVHQKTKLLIFRSRNSFWRGFCFKPTYYRQWRLYKRCFSFNILVRYFYTCIYVSCSIFDQVLQFLSDSFFSLSFSFPLSFFQLYPSLFFVLYFSFYILLLYTFFYLLFFSSLPFLQSFSLFFHFYFDSFFEL